MIKVTDEMLMALADGELDQETAASVRRSVDADPGLQRRLAEFHRSRSVAKQALSGVLDETVPARLAAVLSDAGGRPVARSRSARRAWLPVTAALAASVAGFIVAWAIFRAPVTSPVLGGGIARLMETTPSSDDILPLAGGAGRLQITASYPVPDGICRTFAARSGDAAWRGVACRHDGSWTVDLIVAGQSTADGFVPASDRATQAVDAFLDAAGAGERLDAATEEKLRASGWQGAAPSGGSE